MALVNPQIAMSFRPTVEYQPRNALAEYAQIQSIVGGQRQAEVAEMQLEQLRQDRDALRQIQAAIVAKGGPPDLSAAADAMIKSGRPEYMQQGLRIRETLAQQQRLEAYERQYYPTGAATPSAVPAAAAAASAAAAATEPPIPRGLTSTGAQTFDAMIADEALQNRPPALITGPVTAEEAAAARARNAAPAATAPAAVAPAAVAPAAVAPAAVPAATNALAPAATAPATTNAMRAAAQPDVDALMRRYNQAARAGSPDAPAILKQIEAALRGDQNRLVTVSQGQTAIDPRTGAVLFTAPAAPTAPRIDLIGVAKGTETPVYFDKDTRQQFTIGVDASGKQVQVPYTGAVNRSTSTVTATATAAGSRLESAEQKGKGELNVKQYGDVATAARLAARTLPALDTQAKIIDQGFTTGFGTEVKKAGASVLAALGVPEADKFATDAQTFLAATQQAVLQRQLEQKGPQTEADAQRITQTGAQLGNTVNANRFIIDVARAQLKRDIAQREFYDNWWTNKKTYEGAESAWFSGEGGKSLFDRPELKKYLAPAQGAAAAGAAPAIPQAAINDLRAGRGTDAQFDAIFGAGAAKRVREGK